MSFVRILEAIRIGQATPQMLKVLGAELPKGPSDTSDGILPTQLHTHRTDVDSVNAQRLAELVGSSVSFSCRDSGPNQDALASLCPARKSLELKVGAQVVLIRSLRPAEGLVNGARGVVVGFAKSSSQAPIVKFTNGVETTIHMEKWTFKAGNSVLATRTQVPLDLAWAISVHRSQGMSLDRAEINLEKAFEPGMAYVALSRVRSLEGLRLVGKIAPKALTADPKVVEFYRKLAELQL
eukprot:jgi/Botrbrau1/3202/Bobra.37_2s0032.1